MMKTIYFNEPLSNNFESDWIKIPQKNKYYSKNIRSIEITWSNVQFNATPSPQGFIKFYYSNSMDSQDEFATISINNTENLSNPELIEINNSFKYLKIKFEKNDIISGLLNIVGNVN